MLVMSGPMGTPRHGILLGFLANCKCPRLCAHFAVFLRVAHPDFEGPNLCSAGEAFLDCLVQGVGG